MNTSLLNHLQRILADIFNVPTTQVNQESSPDTIENWDSLNHLNLVLAIEQEFGIMFTPEEIEQLVSVQLIGKVLDDKLHAAGRPL